MIGFARTALAVLLSVIPTLAADVPTIESTRAKDDIRLTLDPAADFWKKAHPVFIDKDRFGNPVHAYRSEVRTRWTKDNLYFLFICPYKELSLKPNPNTHDETNELWNWEVAEAFIGSGFFRHPALQGVRSLSPGRMGRPRYRPEEASSRRWLDLELGLRGSGENRFPKTHLVCRDAHTVQRDRHAPGRVRQHAAHQSVSQRRPADSSLRHNLATDHEQNIPHAREIRLDQTGRGGQIEIQSLN